MRPKTITPALDTQNTIDIRALFCKRCHFEQSIAYDRGTNATPLPPPGTVNEVLIR